MLNQANVFPPLLFQTSPSAPLFGVVGNSWRQGTEKSHVKKLYHKLFGAHTEHFLGPKNRVDVAHILGKNAGGGGGFKNGAQNGRLIGHKKFRCLYVRSFATLLSSAFPFN